MAIKPLLIERLVAELTLDAWVGAMMLALVVGQACFMDKLGKSSRGSHNAGHSLC